MVRQDQMLDRINEKQQVLSHEWFNYWKDFSSFNTWQFWLMLLLFIIPLVIIFFNIDRKHAFQIGFYGFNVHVWFGYIDRFGTSQGYWDYPYQWLIFLPNSISLDASLIPVLYMLVYQRTWGNTKNYYLFTFILSAVLSFVVKPILSMSNLFKLYQGANFFHLFLGYIIILVLSKLITDLFLYFQKTSQAN
jgi:hypothetical protein